MARFSILLVCLMTLLPSQLAAAGPSTDAKAELITQFKHARDDITHNAFGLPLSLASVEQDDLLQGQVLGIIEHDYATARAIFTRPDHWCDTLLLHLNTKACTYQNASATRIDLFSGRKFYQPIKKAKPISLDFAIIDNRDDFVRVQLHGAKGPLGTSDYAIELSAMALPSTKAGTADQQRSLLRLRFSYRTTWLARQMMNLYLSQMARDKVGFTIVDQHQQPPVYIGGLQGIIERNTMRYYLAIHTRLDGVKHAHSMHQQFSRWFDATEKYHRQLHEVSKTDYLQAKQRELANQRDRQQLIQTANNPRLASFRQ
ncbi:MAG: hypothetical protein QNJ69_07545 [Gammaproteobacteria bacterium]|nr:hypothetical protein [Gammaproteobacteria bacterium]